jgi:hypothetical protein
VLGHDKNQLSLSELSPTPGCGRLVQRSLPWALTTCVKSPTEVVGFVV